jgi:hypothetical protein
MTTDTPSTLKVRTKVSAAEKQSNYDRVYETQVKQFCFQQAAQHCLTDGTQTPKAPPIETILKNADLMWQWFSEGKVPVKSADIRALN